jgi:hypothetical protein
MKSSKTRGSGAADGWIQPAQRSDEPVLAGSTDHRAELVHLLRQVHPDLTPAAARVQVQAALMIANDVARTARLRTLAGAAEAVADVCAQALALPR